MLAFLNREAAKAVATILACKFADRPGVFTVSGCFVFNPSKRSVYFLPSWPQGGAVALVLVTDSLSVLWEQTDTRGDYIGPSYCSGFPITCTLLLLLCVALGHCCEGQSVVSLLLGRR
jgi:hypothetical protein